MTFHQFTKEKISRLDWLDMGLVKLSVAAFTIWILSWIKDLSWIYSYKWEIFALAIILALRPFIQAYIKKG